MYLSVTVKLSRAKRICIYSIVMKKVNKLVAEEAARSESKVLRLFELFLTTLPTDGLLIND